MKTEKIQAVPSTALGLAKLKPAQKLRRAEIARLRHETTCYDAFCWASRARATGVDIGDIRKYFTNEAKRRANMVVHDWIIDGRDRSNDDLIIYSKGKYSTEYHIVWRSEASKWLADEATSFISGLSFNDLERNDQYLVESDAEYWLEPEEIEAGPDWDALAQEFISGRYDTEELAQNFKDFWSEFDIDYLMAKFEAYKEFDAESI